MRERTPGHIVALLIGVGAVATDVGFNIVNAISKTGTIYDPQIPGVLVAGAISVVSVACISQCWSERKFVSCGLVVALMACAMGFSFIQSIDRVTQQHENALRVAAEAEQQRRIASSVDVVRINEARRIIQDDNLIEIVQRECVDDIVQNGQVIRNVAYDPARFRPEDWPRCATAHKRLTDLRAEIEQGQAMLAAVTHVELWEVDASAKSLARVGLDQQAVSAFTPWLLPLVLLIGGAVLIHVGWSGRSVTFGERVKRYVAEITDATGKRPTIKSIAKQFDISEARAKRYMA